MGDNRNYEHSHDSVYILGNILTKVDTIKSKPRSKPAFASEVCVVDDHRCHEYSGVEIVWTIV